MKMKQKTAAENQAERTKENERADSPMMRIPEEERPYEKCLAFGERALTDAELLSVMLRSGTSGESALDLSRRVLRQFGEDALTGLCHQSIPEMMTIRGVGKVKAVQLKCIAELSRRIARSEYSRSVCFRDPESVAAYYMEDYRHEEQEKVLVVMLDGAGALIGEEVLFQGTADMALISPREIFLCALRRRSASILLLHNHPSGDPTPSEQDLAMTVRVRKAGELIGIPLLDHIILGDRKAVSLRQEDLL